MEITNRNLQAERVAMLSGMVIEKITTYQEERAAYRSWKKDNPKRYLWEYPGKISVTPTELKRIMLILRQETVRLEKVL